MGTDRRWTIVWLLCLGVTIGYVDRTNLSVALASAEFKAALSLSDQQRGALNSAFFWSYALCQIPAGWIVDRFGVKRTFGLGFLIWSAVSALTAYSTSFEMLLGLRLLLGIGESVCIPASLRWIRFHTEESRRGTAVGIVMAGTKFGPAIGAPLAAWLVARHGWSDMFLILAVAGTVWLLPWVLLVKDDDRELEKEAVRTSGLKDRGSFAQLFRTPVMWGIIFGSFAYNYFVYYNMTWLPAYFVESRGMSLSSMGWYTMMSFGGMALVAIGAGALADRLIARGYDPVNTRRWFTCVGFVCASTEILGTMTASNDLAKFFAVFSMCGLGLATANYWALTQTLLPGASIGRIVGVQNFAVNLAGVAAPLVTGWLKESTGGYQAPMQAIWVILLMGLGSYLFLVKRPKPVTAAG